MKTLSKSQERRFKVQKDPKKRARVTQRHESVTKYTRKGRRGAQTNEE